MNYQRAYAKIGRKDNQVRLTKKPLACAAEISAAPFQPSMRLPTQPIQGRQFGLECFDPFDGAVGPFGLDGPVSGVSYHEKNRFTHNFKPQ
jgi:hypothetical protein